MKNSIQHMILLIVAVMATFSGCEPKYPDVPAQSDKQTTNISFINALPDDSLVTFKVNNTVVSNSLPSGSWSGYSAVTMGPNVIGAVSPSTGLTVSTTSGVFPYAIGSSAFVTLSSSTASVSAAMASNPTLFPNGYFTVIVQGAVVKQRSKLVLTDVLNAPASGKANVRLVNAITSGFAAGLSYTTTSAGIISSRTYNASAASVQGFTSIDPTKMIYLLNVSTSVGIAIIDSLNGGTLVSGGNYTLLAVKKSGKSKLTYFQNQ